MQSRLFSIMSAVGLLAGSVLVTAAAPTAVAAPAPALSAAAGLDATGTYYSVSPFRAYDSRSVAPRTPLGAKQTRSIKVVGAGGVPATGVSAVVVNLTAVAPTTGSYLTVYPNGTARPTVSSLNFAARANRANLATVPVGADGRIAVYNEHGSTHVLVDVVGFYAANDSVRTASGRMGSQYYPLSSPQRGFDSRYDGGPLGPGVGVNLEFDLGPDAAALTDLAVNITAVAPAAAGYLVAWDGVGALPSTSTLNFGARSTVPNMAVLKVSHPTATTIGITIVNASSGSSNVLVDIVGDYSAAPGDGLRFRAVKPTRVLDTRSGAPLGAAASRRVTLPAAMVNENTYALVGNGTAVRPTTSTWLTIWAGAPGMPMPGVSNLNAAPGEVVANAVSTEVGLDYDFVVRNANGSVHTLFDVMGVFDLYEAPAAAGLKGAINAAPAAGSDKAVVPHGESFGRAEATRR